MTRLPVLFCIVALAGLSRPVLAADVGDPAAVLVDDGPTRGQTQMIGGMTQMQETG